MNRKSHACPSPCKPSGAVALLCIVFGGLVMAEAGGKWQVPLGGNAYLTAAAAGSTDRIDLSGANVWTSAESVFSVYFRTDRAATFDLALRLSVKEGESVIRASVAGGVFEKSIAAGEWQVVPLGKVSVERAGYVRVDLQGLRKSGEAFAEVSDLVVSTAAEGVALDYVKDDGDGRFYWGRRGPSVHLRYGLPAGKTPEFFHNEVTVPEG